MTSRSPDSRRRAEGASKKTAADVRAWLIARLSEELRIPALELDVSEPFASYGVDSVRAVGLSGELEEWLGRRLSPTLLYDYPTIEAVARHVTGLSERVESLAASDGAPAARPEPIAIIGIGCRVPGASGPQAFWRLLCDGVDAITEVPPDRWDLRAFYDPDPAAPGKMNTRWGGFIERVDEFDYRFFGISPREAARIDPQQRLLLEMAWEALEDAGQAPASLAGTSTGVFVGISTNEYSRIQLGDPALIDAYAGTGNALSIAANRISYTFDFRGPSLAVDTACSSSLVAVHLACQSLWAGDATLALAGGVNLILSPALTVNFTKAGAMAPDGRCKAFDARANGYVRGEGVVLVVLKPLSNALADADPIYAVIRGSAVNQDGRTNGLMAPNRLAQEAVLREAYRRAAVSPGEVQYVEAHGTGTLLGDPIEASALATVLATDRAGDRPCAIGSVKTNIGHLEAAAGGAGLIKVALSLKHRAIPPSLHFETPNPHIPFAELPLRVQQTLAPWPEREGARLAGVSSFGFGGTNAHVVLEAPPPERGSPRAPEDGASRAVHLLPLSARSQSGLTGLARAFREWALAEGASIAALPDACYTAAVRRSHHEYRLALTASSWDDVVRHLDAFLQGDLRPGVATGRRSAQPRKLVFVFPGSGAQWPGMGRQLLECSPIFRETIVRCDQAMRGYLDTPLLTAITADEPQARLDEIDVFQPALFAIEVALTALWRSWGIEPAAVVGHSMGEITAAHVAGVLTLEEAVRVICRRSRLLKRLSGQGRMASVELSVDDARRAIAGYQDRLSIAASNSPTSTLLSGDTAALDEVLDALQRRGVFCRVVKSDVATHNPQMDPLRPELAAALDGLAPRPPSIAIYSTVTGAVSMGDGFDAAYWMRNLRDPVLFSATVQQLIDDGHDVFLEVSPHPVLLSAIQQGLHHRGREGAVLPSGRRGVDPWGVLLGSLGALYALGHSVDWRRLPAEGARCVALPAYPWQRERCRLETGERPERAWDGTRGSDRVRHVDLAHEPGTHLWQMDIDGEALPDAREHRLQGAAILSAAACIDLIVRAARETLHGGPWALHDVEFHRAVFVPERGGRGSQIVFSRQAEGRVAFRLYSAAAPAATESWTLNVSGELSESADRVTVDAGAAVREIQDRCREEITGEEHYRRLRERGVDYGPRFQTIERIWRGPEEALASVRPVETVEPDAAAARLHPAALEACFQALVAALPQRPGDAQSGVLYVPVRVARVRTGGRSDVRLWGHARLRKPGESETEDPMGIVRLLDDAGGVVAEVDGVRFRRLGPEAPHDGPADVEKWIYEVAWQAQERAARLDGAASSSGRPGTWLVFTDSGGVGRELTAFLTARGEECMHVEHGETYERLGDGDFRIAPTRAEHVREVLAALQQPDHPPCRGIVHLWSLDAPPADKATWAAQTLGCESVLALVQELARIGWAAPPALWLVTRGAQALGRESGGPAVEQAPLWGFGRVIAEEHPSLWGGLVDLDPRASAPESAVLLGAEVSDPARDGELAFHDGRRFVPRLARVRKAPARLPALPWRTNASYLITGGLGDLGREVARWMVRQGARRIILLGRSELPPRSTWSAVRPGTRLAAQVSTIQELEALGASVHVAAVDVGDERQLASFLTAFRRDGWPPIRGLVHLAAVLEDRLLDQLDAAALATVLRPKAEGAWLLHRLLADVPLDFFVLFSSAGSLLGQAGQANYAAANAFVDALAHLRRAEGRHALAVNWGAWADLGFAATPGGQRLARHAATRGIATVPATQALAVLERLLAGNLAQAVVLPVDWRRCRAFYDAGHEPALLSGLMQEASAAAPETAASTQRLSRQLVLSLEPDERRLRLEAYVCEYVARVLGLSASDLDAHQPLNTVGLDSLMAVQVKNRIEVDLGVVVPVVNFLSGPSAAELAREVGEQLSAAAPAAPAPEPRREGATQLLASVDSLSEREVDALLSDLLREEESHE